MSRDQHAAAMSSSGVGMDVVHLVFHLGMWLTVDNELPNIRSPTYPVTPCYAYAGSLDRCATSGRVSMSHPGNGDI